MPCGHAFILPQQRAQFLEHRRCSPWVTGTRTRYKVEQVEASISTLVVPFSLSVSLSHTLMHTQERGMATRKVPCLIENPNTVSYFSFLSFFFNGDTWCTWKFPGKELTWATAETSTTTVVTPDPSTHCIRLGREPAPPQQPELDSFKPLSHGRNSCPILFVCDFTDFFFFFLMVIKKPNIELNILTIFKLGDAFTLHKNHHHPSPKFHLPKLKLNIHETLTAHAPLALAPGTHPSAFCLYDSDTSWYLL